MRIDGERRGPSILGRRFAAALLPLDMGLAGVCGFTGALGRDPGGEIFLETGGGSGQRRARGRSRGWVGPFGSVMLNSRSRLPLSRCFAMLFGGGGGFGAAGGGRGGALFASGREALMNDLLASWMGTQAARASGRGSGRANAERRPSSRSSSTAAACEQGAEGVVVIDERKVGLLEGGAWSTCGSHSLSLALQPRPWREPIARGSMTRGRCATLAREWPGFPGSRVPPADDALVDGSRLAERVGRLLAVDLRLGIVAELQHRLQSNFSSLSSLSVLAHMHAAAEGSLLLIECCA